MIFSRVEGLWEWGCLGFRNFGGFSSVGGGVGRGAFSFVVCFF